MVRFPLSYVSWQPCKVFKMCISCCVTHQRWKLLLPLGLGEIQAIPPDWCTSVPQMMVEHGKVRYMVPLSLQLIHLALQEAQDLLQRFLKWILLVWLWHFTQHRFVISWGQSLQGWAFFLAPVRTAGSSQIHGFSSTNHTRPKDRDYWMSSLVPINWSW